MAARIKANLSLTPQKHHLLPSELVPDMLWLQPHTLAPTFSLCALFPYTQNKFLVLVWHGCQDLRVQLLGRAERCACHVGAIPATALLLRCF